MKLSLIIPCYNEERTIENCIEKVMELRIRAKNFSFLQNTPLQLEIIVVDDCSTDKSYEILQRISEHYSEVIVFKHNKNRGKGAALRTGLISATGDFVGIQDADEEYNPVDYITMLEPLLEGKADVVYGSRYLKRGARRVLYFWHTWMNKKLTKISNMFTNLDITDMETCYKLFRREVIQQIAPTLKENRFGFEPEITVKVAQSGCRVYETAISYNPRSYEEGKKIGWKDGLRALYCLLHYGASTAPMPMQLLLYFFIGGVSMLANLACFAAMTFSGFSINWSIGVAFVLAAIINYILCILILFRHNARWKTPGELFWYLVTIVIMGGLDFVITGGLISLTFSNIWAKIWSSVVGFLGNFILRKWLIFPEKNKKLFN